MLFLPVAFPPAFGVVAFRVRLACRALLPHVLPLRRSACRVSLRCAHFGFARRARLLHAALCASLRFVYRALPSVCHASFRARLRGSPLWQLVAVGSGQRCVFVGAAPSTPFAAFGSTTSRPSLPVRALAPSLVARASAPLDRSASSQLLAVCLAVAVGLPAGRNGGGAPHNKQRGARLAIQTRPPRFRVALPCCKGRRGSAYRSFGLRRARSTRRIASSASSATLARRPRRLRRRLPQRRASLQTSSA